jgi:hypothetical protein
MRVDLSINIPTILSVLVSIVAVSTTGVTLYYGLDKRQLASEFEIAKINQRIEKVETGVSNLRTEQAQREGALRAEMRSDISEIKDLLYRLYPGTPVARSNAPATQQQLNEWRKQ